MKNKLIDIADMVEKILRAMFWLCLGMFLTGKAFLILTQPAYGLPKWFIAVGIILPTLVTIMIAVKVILEPTPADRRKQKRLMELLEEGLNEIEEKSKIRQGGDANKRG